MAEPTLYTFPPSLDSEFSRFVLCHYDVSVREDRHVIPFQSVVTLIKAGTPRIPTLQGAGASRLDTVAKIINHLETRASPERRLLAGVDPASMRADWQEFHQVLQTASTVFPYYYLLPRRDLMVRALSEGSPSFEVRAVQKAYPVFALMLRALLRLTAQRAAEARATILFIALKDRSASQRRPAIPGWRPIHSARHGLRDRGRADDLARQLRRPASSARRYTRSRAGARGRVSRKALQGRSRFASTATTATPDDTPSPGRGSWQLQAAMSSKGQQSQRHRGAWQRDFAGSVHRFSRGAAFALGDGPAETRAPRPGSPVGNWVQDAWHDDQRAGHASCTSSTIIARSRPERSALSPLGHARFLPAITLRGSRTRVAASPR